MARKKVNLAWISNDTTRRATMKKRRKGLMKKVKELSILCDVPSCAIMYSPHEAQPEVWPSVAEATHIILSFRAMPGMEQSKKMMNQEAFLRQRISKLHDQLRRHKRDDCELEFAALLRECISTGASTISNLRIEELATLAWILEHKAKAIKDGIDHLHIEPMTANVTSALLNEATTGDSQWAPLHHLSNPSSQPMMASDVRNMINDIKEYDMYSHIEKMPDIFTGEDIRNASNVASKELSCQIKDTQLDDTVGEWPGAGGVSVDSALEVVTLVEQHSQQTSSWQEDFQF